MPDTTTPKTMLLALIILITTMGAQAALATPAQGEQSSTAIEIKV